MTYIPRTPFGRVGSAVPMERPEAPAPSVAVNKWDILRDLTTARAMFDLSHRDLSVLQTLLGFHRDTVLTGRAGEVVHPSNATICARLHGMPCSTMRRHLAKLVRAGVILRRDSPNGKRYVRRLDGAQHAFGFDLSVLVRLAPQIRAEAERINTENAERAALRCDVVLMRRDLVAMAGQGASGDVLDLLDQTTKALRRKLSHSDLTALAMRLEQTLATLSPPPATPEMSSNDAQTEHHHQNTNQETLESEDLTTRATQMPEFPLVLAKCKEARAFATETLSNWSDFVGLIDRLRPMMGLTDAVWIKARDSMGPIQAAVVAAAMLERWSAIRSPNGYLRHLTDKAKRGQFSCLPMLAALPKSSQL